MKARTSSSVVFFGPKIEKYWGLKKWEGLDDPDQDVLFFGLYHEHDFAAWRHHEGKKTVFWCGSDITRLLNIPERQRVIKMVEAKHYCETAQEAEELRSIDIEAEVKPSFLDDINNFPISFKPTDKPHIWLCAHPDREGEYGVHLVEEMAKKFPTYTFHIYGIDGKDYENIKYHGKVLEEQLNNEIRNYHCGLRANIHDGFSEIVMKSVLLGQYPISFLPYEKVWSYEDKEDLEILLARLATIKEPNLEAREYYLSIANRYPWM